MVCMSTLKKSIGKMKISEANIEKLEGSKFDKQLYFLMFKNAFSRHENMRGYCYVCTEDNKPCVVEEALFLSTAEALSKEAEEEGIELTYSAQLLIGQASMTAVRLFRAQLMEAIDFGIEEDYMITSGKIHGLYYGYIPKLQKALVFFLDQLGITPRKKAERRAVKVTKSLQMEIEAMQDKFVQKKKISVSDSRIVS